MSAEALDLDDKALPLQYTATLCYSETSWDCEIVFSLLLFLGVYFPIAFYVFFLYFSEPFFVFLTLFFLVCQQQLPNFFYKAFNADFDLQTL